MNAAFRAGTLVAGATALAMAMAACSNEDPTENTPPPPPASAPDGSVSEILDEVRAATAQYHDVEVAMADGYELLGECVDNMGYHYFRENDDLTQLEVGDPDVMVYAPDGNDGLRLVAIEYATTANDAEAAFGIPFNEPGGLFGDELLTLHAWVWLGNPDGTFEPFNPLVSCDE